MGRRYPLPFDAAFRWRGKPRSSGVVTIAWARRFGASLHGFIPGRRSHGHNCGRLRYLEFDRLVVLARPIDPPAVAFAPLVTVPAPHLALGSGERTHEVLRIALLLPPGARHRLKWPLDDEMPRRAGEVQVVTPVTAGVCLHAWPEQEPRAFLDGCQNTLPLGDGMIQRCFPGLVLWNTGAAFGGDSGSDRENRRVLVYG